LSAADMAGLQETLFTLFATIPYQHFTNNNIANYEGYYASVIYAYLASLGFNTTAEDTTQKGSIDLSLKLADKCYLFEFKVVTKAKGQALTQIKQKRYFEKYIHYPNLYLIGIEFGKSERNIVQFTWERFDKQAYATSNLGTARK